MIVALKNQPKNKVDELLIALIKQTERVVNKTGHNDAKTRLSQYNNLLNAPNYKRVYLEAYGPTWDKYISANTKEGFNTFKSMELYEESQEEAITDNLGHEISVNNTILAYFEDGGIVVCKLEGFTNRGLKLLRHDSKNIVYIPKTSTHRIVKVNA